MPSVTLQDSLQRAECADGESIFDVLGRHGIRLPSACGGQGRCGLCRVRIVAGEEGLSPLTADERRHLGNACFVTRTRLACQARVSGDVVVTLPPGARTAAAARRSARGGEPSPRAYDPEECPRSGPSPSAASAGSTSSSTRSSRSR